MTCCNQDCNQGRDCPNRESWDLIETYIVITVVCLIGLTALIWGVMT